MVADKLQAQNVSSLSEVKQLASELRRSMAPGQLWCFTGDLGAGKTELIRQLVRTFNPQEVVTSPTFNLENHYPQDSFTVSHWDLYRLRDIEKLPDLDEQIGDTNYLCLVEWPERYPGLMERADFLVSISLVPGTETRSITIKAAKSAKN